MKARVLVADDDDAMREVMSLALAKEGFSVTRASTAAEATAAVTSQSFDLVVADIYLGDGSGLDVVEALTTGGAATPVILVTARGTIETAASARTRGVFDYLAKPFELDRFLSRVHAALAAEATQTTSTSDGPESMIVGSDPAIVEVYKAVARVAPLAVPVLIRGETGTGKELVATALHRFGAAPDGPFIAINCGAIPEALLESELFGHRRGAFTGADSDRAGAVESARGGTLFLDEVGELPIALQVKLLRFLQSGEIRPVGSSRAVQVPVRVVAATHRDLRAEARAGRFREDVYYRLAAYEIELPPLRDRSSDLPLLVEHFRRRYGGEQTTAASADVLRRLAAFSWPGYVRQLEHVVQRAIIDSGGLADADAVTTVLAAMDDRDAEAANQPAIGDDLTLTELERLHIKAVLERCAGNRTRAARILGIERKSLYRKIVRLGIRGQLEDEP